MSENMFNWEKDADGVVILTMDDPNQGANTMNDLFVTSLNATVERLEAEKDDIAGVILTSAKKTFFAGGDLKDMTADKPKDVTKADIATAITERANGMKATMRRLETLGKPVVAAINGAALGGGLEIALHCHYRVAADTRGSKIGLPEVTLGLLPGGGGVVRTVRLLGMQNALMGVLLQGTQFNPTKAKETGLVDEVVGTVEELIPAAKKWIKDNPEAQQPFDVKGYKIPGGAPTNPAVAANLPAYKNLPVLSVSAPFKSGFAGGSDFTDVKAGNVAINENLTLDLSAAPGVTVTGTATGAATVTDGADTGCSDGPVSDPPQPASIAASTTAISRRVMAAPASPAAAGPSRSPSSWSRPRWTARLATARAASSTARSQRSSCRVARPCPRGPAAPSRSR